MATHDPLRIRWRIGARPGRLTRALAAILALTLSTVLALTLPHAMPSAGHAATAPIERLDVHLNGTDRQETEINVVLGTGNDCETTLSSGQYCLRYSVTQDDKGVDVGFGVISSTDVQVNGATLRLQEDTTKANFRHLQGRGGSINLTLTPGKPGSPATARGRSTTLAPTNVRGTVDGRPVAGGQLQASVLYSNP